MDRFSILRKTVFRRATASVMAGLLLSAQLAVAMHACPAHHATRATHATPGAQTAAVESASSTRDCDCPTEAADRSAVCQKHCQNEPVSDRQDQPKPFAVDHNAFVAVILTPADVPQATLSTRAPSSDDRLLTSPPFLRSAVLRI
jgi:hypothetical protein